MMVAEVHALTVPPVAVQRGPQGSYVFVVGPDNLAERRPVALGPESQRIAIVTSGLRAGESVVVDGAARLTDKIKVTVLPAPGGTGPS